MFGAPHSINSDIYIAERIQMERRVSVVVLSVRDKVNGYNIGERVSFDPVKAAALVSKGWAALVCENVLPSEVTEAGGVEAYLAKKASDKAGQKKPV